jgi:hypothetical protein
VKVRPHDNCKTSYLHRDRARRKAARAVEQDVHQRADHEIIAPEQRSAIGARQGLRQRVDEARGDLVGLLGYDVVDEALAQGKGQDEDAALACVLKDAASARQCYWTSLSRVLVCSGGSIERPIRTKPLMPGL